MALSYQELELVYPVRTILDNLGLNRIEESSSYFKFSSPFREDKNPSMVLYKKNLFCIDFASGYRASLFKLVKDMTGQTLYTYTDIDPKKFSSNIFKSSLIGEKISFPERRKSLVIEGKLSSVESYDEALNYCNERNVFKEFRKDFDIKYSPFTKINGTTFSKRLCIPVIENNKLVSMEGRDVTRKQKTKVLYPKGGSVSTLFNIDNLKRDEPLVVVEGIMDIPKIWKYFTKNITTTFGIMITNKQRELLNTFSDVILFPDGDEAGRRMISEFDNFYEGEFRVAYIEGVDPGDAFMKDVEKVILNPISSVNYFLEESQLFEKKKNINFFQ
jgi:hypothetical protein